MRAGCRACTWRPRRVAKARIERFAKAQRRRREWINFAEFADWFAREDQSIEPLVAALNPAIPGAAMSACKLTVSPEIELMNP